MSANVEMITLVFTGARDAADEHVLFQDGHRHPALAKLHGRRKAGRAGADHDDMAAWSIGVDD